MISKGQALSDQVKQATPPSVKRSIRDAGGRFDAWMHRMVLPAPVTIQAEDAWWDQTATNADFVDEAYRRCLQREADPDGRGFYLGRLDDGSATRLQVVAELMAAPERTARMRDTAAIEAFHGGRIVWTRSLPPKRRILDLGGTALNDDRGALVVMGYPYEFDEVVIIELPPEDRHDLYKTPENKSVHTEQGLVTYMYRSMTDLDDLPDGSFDMVCSAQTFEHIYPDEGAKLLKDVRRILAPDGVLALDTPNGPVSSIQAREGGVEFINPDHKKEYSHSEMLTLFADAELRVVRQCGIGFMPKTVESGVFHIDELVEFPTLYDDIERSYTLAYLATPI